MACRFIAVGSKCCHRPLMLCQCRMMRAKLAGRCRSHSGNGSAGMLWPKGPSCVLRDYMFAVDVGPELCSRVTRNPEV